MSAMISIILEILKEMRKIATYTQTFPLATILSIFIVHCFDYLDHILHTQQKSNWNILGVSKEEENLCKCSIFEHFHPISTSLFLHEPRANMHNEHKVV